MGTTADKLNKLLNTKQAIKQAIVDKGVEVGDDTKFSDYPAKINSIQTGDAESVWKIVTNNWTRFSYLFKDCRNLKSIDVVSGWDTSNINDMSYMFATCTGLTSLDLSNWDTSNVVTFQNMFYFCESLTSLDLSNFDTKNATIMAYMFYNCSKLTQLDVSNFNTSKVTNMNNMFANCTQLKSLDMSGCDVNKVVTNTYFNNILGASLNNACGNLTDFKAPKNIGANLDVQYCTKLSHDSLMSIINNLKTVTSTKTLTLGATNLAKLTDAEKAIATNKGWTLK